MPRFTRDNLNYFLGRVNFRLAEGKSPYRLEAEGRNGYIAIDVYKNGDCLHMVGAGNTPKEAKFIALEWVMANSVAIVTEK